MLAAHASFLTSITWSHWGGSSARSAGGVGHPLCHLHWARASPWIQEAATFAVVSKVFDAVLDRNVPRRQIGKGALLAMGAHAALLAGALLFSGARSAVSEHQDLFVTFSGGPLSGAGHDGDHGGRESSSELAERAGAVAKPTTPAVDRAHASKPIAVVKPHVEPAATETPPVVNPNPPPAPSQLPAIGTAAAENGAASAPSTTAAAGSSGGGVMTGAGGGHGTGGGGTSGAGVAAGATSGHGVAAQRSDSLTVIPFGEGMTRPTLLSKVDPTYTRDALAAKVEGLMLMKCTITVRGSLENCRVVKGLPYMDGAVLSVLAQWKYSPVLFQGKPVNVDYVIPVRLVLP